MGSMCYLSIGLILKTDGRAHLAILRTVKISPGPQPMIVVSGTLASAPALQRLLSQSYLMMPYIQSIKFQVVVQGNDGGRTTHQVKPDFNRKEHSRQDPSPTSCQTKLYFERTARSDCQLTPSQSEGRHTISGYAREDPRGVGIGSVISLS